MRFPKLLELTAAAALALAITVPASGPRGDFAPVAQTHRGCAADSAKFCSPTHSGSRVQASCLRQYWVNLSPECRKTLGKPKDADGTQTDSGE